MPIVSDSGEPLDEAFGVIPVLRRGSSAPFLLIQHHAGHWAFPKGHADPDEDGISAARRELLEETGIRDVTLDLSRAFTEQYFKAGRAGSRPIRKTVHDFLGVVTEPNVRPQPEEIRDFRWATLDEARKLITYAESRRLLEEAAQAMGI